MIPVPISQNSAPMAVSPQWQLPQFDCPNGSETAYTCCTQTAYTCGEQTAFSVKLAYIYILNWLPIRQLFSVALWKIQSIRFIRSGQWLHAVISGCMQLPVVVFSGSGQWLHEVDTFSGQWLHEVVSSQWLNELVSGYMQ